MKKNFLLVFIGDEYSVFRYRYSGLIFALAISQSLTIKSMACRGKASVRSCPPYSIDVCSVRLFPGNAIDSMGTVSGNVLSVIFTAKC